MQSELINQRGYSFRRLFFFLVVSRLTKAATMGTCVAFPQSGGRDSSIVDRVSNSRTAKEARDVANHRRFSSDPFFLSRFAWHARFAANFLANRVFAQVEQGLSRIRHANNVVVASILETKFMEIEYYRRELGRRRRGDKLGVSVGNRSSCFHENYH